MAYPFCMGYWIWEIKGDEGIPECHSGQWTCQDKYEPRIKTNMNQEPGIKSQDKSLTTDRRYK